MYPCSWSVSIDQNDKLILICEKRRCYLLIVIATIIVIIAAAGGGRGTRLAVRHEETWSRKVRSLQYQAAEGVLIKERCHHTPNSSKNVCCPQLSEGRRQSIFNTVRQQIKSEQGMWNWYSSHIDEVSMLTIETSCQKNTKFTYQYCCVSMVKSCPDWAGILYSWDVLFLNTHVMLND